MTRSLSLPIVAVALVLWPSASQAADSATRSVMVVARFDSRVSLKVSTEILRFDVAEADGAATTTVDFSAAARTTSGAEVVLAIEPLRTIGGPGGPVDVEPPVTFSGEGEGTLAGSIVSDAITPAARWSGSGLRSGRILFTLRGAPGIYTLAVRFVLSAP